MQRVLQTAAGFVVVGLLIGGGQDAAAQPEPPPATLGEVSPTVDHPLYPLASLRAGVYAGEERDPDSGEVVTLRVEFRVLPEPARVAELEVTVVEVKEYEDDELVEQTRDYYVQGADGTVYYVGEDVDDYEDGEVTGHSGEWLAGEGENRAGVFLPVDLSVGQTFAQEWAPGIAEDWSTVLELDAALTIPAGSFTGCLRTEDINPLDGDIETKTYCPGVGLVREESANGRLDLVSFELVSDAGSPVATPAL